MRKYQATIYSGRYPFTVSVEASGWSVAAARAVRLWQKRFRRDSSDTLKIQIIKGSIIIKD